MSNWNRRLLPAIALYAVLTGCQSGPAEGEYVTFVRDIMTESAKLKEAAGEGPEHTEQVERAVRVWRGADDDEISSMR